MKTKREHFDEALKEIGSIAYNDRWIKFEPLTRRLLWLVFNIGWERGRRAK